MKKYIIHKKKEFLYSDDNWKTIQHKVAETPDGDYKLETNQNLAFLVRLEYQYGKKIKNYIKKQFEEIYKKYEEKTGKELSGYGDAFEIFAISVLHEIPIDEVIDKYIVIGQYDGKVDAIVYDKDNCYVYQIKMSEVSDDVLSKMEENVTKYTKGTLSADPNCRHLQEFLSKMNPQITAISNIEYKTISLNSKLPTNINTNEVFVKYIADKVVCFSKNKELTITVNDPSFKQATVASKDKKIFFMFAKADTLISDLKNFFNDRFTFDDICASNVRGKLAVSKDMEFTIANEPESFCSYNNGISITGTFNPPKGNSYSLVIKNPNIINGQQTLYNLYYQQEVKNVDISKITVPVFIKKCDSDDQERKIGKYNNTQKAVKAVDLLSIDTNLRHIQRELIEKKTSEGYYLKLVSSGSKEFLEEMKKIYDRDHIIKVSDFVKLYSVIKKPSKLGDWKNNYNKQIESTYDNGFDVCDVELANKICKAISLSKPIIRGERETFSIADLALQLLIFKENDIELCKQLIVETTNKFKGSGRPADVFKANAYKNIRETINANKTKYEHIDF